MPHRFPFASHGNDDTLQVQETSEDVQRKPSRRPSILKNLGSLWKRHHDNADHLSQAVPGEQSQTPSEPLSKRRRSLEDHAPHQRAIPSLPRPQTFRRQESEKREKLLEVKQDHVERRASSADRRRGLSASAARRPRSPRPAPIPSASAPEVNQPDQLRINQSNDGSATTNKSGSRRSPPIELPPLEIPEQPDGDLEVNDADDGRSIDQTALQEDYDQRWILNLSMHFRDKSQREKFFVTFAERPNYWRRITISVDYRNPPEGSLEADLKTLHYQRDKSFRIFKAIRESLPEIQYYETVTNLKLVTTPQDGQLHVYVREDANEIIQYPSVSLFEHVHARKIAERDLEFISHISGFVYKVRAEGSIVIKKEIPGPDTIDEFLYEVNALDSLLGCSNIVQLEGLVTDDSGAVVKGLLISYAPQGALVDMIYDFRNTAELPWHRREKWAKQIVNGLSEIHEAGFVQGDFTLSNIVIDVHDNVQIIDINRRGCPVGWEPPELGRLIGSGQRIGMCIGVKTDLFQLGMVLWALAEEVDEPERVERPLPPVVDEVPEYFRKMVATCLSTRPQNRSSAKKLLHQFPPTAGLPAYNARRSVEFPEDPKRSSNSVSTSHRSDKEYIDPKFAMTIDDVRRRRTNSGLTDFTSGQVTYVDPDSNPASTSYRFGSSGSWIVGQRRGRSPVSSRRRRSSPYARAASSTTSLSCEESPARRLQRGPACGSEISGEDNVGEHTVSVPYPSEIRAADLEPPVIEITPDEDGVGSRNDDEQQPPQPLDTRIDEMGYEDPSHMLHADSGFAEKMVNDLNIDEPATIVKHSEQPIGDVMAAMPATAPEEWVTSSTFRENSLKAEEHYSNEINEKRQT